MDEGITKLEKKIVQLNDEIADIRKKMKRVPHHKGRDLLNKLRKLRKSRGILLEEQHQIVMENIQKSALELSDKQRKAEKREKEELSNVLE